MCKSPTLLIRNKMQCLRHRTAHTIRHHSRHCFGKVLVDKEEEEEIDDSECIILCLPIFVLVEAAGYIKRGSVPSMSSRLVERLRQQALAVLPTCWAVEVPSTQPHRSECPYKSASRQHDAVCRRMQYMIRRQIHSVYRSYRAISENDGLFSGH